MQVVLYNAMLERNEGSLNTSYHITGSIDFEGKQHLPIDLWTGAAGTAPAALQAAILTGDRFTRIYANGTREGVIKGIELHIEETDRKIQIDLENARLIHSDLVHAGDRFEVEATVRPFQQAPRNVRIPVQLPSRLTPGNLRLLISDGATLDRALDQMHLQSKPVDLESTLAQALRQHTADRIYVSLLAPETQAGVTGQALSGLPLSVANALEPLRNPGELSLNGESVEVESEMPVDGFITGFQVINLRIEEGGGLN
jgi:hypothetical protein